MNRLPSPDEKAQAAAQLFTAQVVRMDVTGRRFERMTQFRRSLTLVNTSAAAAAAADATEATPRKRQRRRSGAKKRRNTIACDGDRRHIDDAELRHQDAPQASAQGSSRCSLRHRLNLVHLLRGVGASTPSTSSKPASTTDMSYEEGDTVTQTETDATSHASSVDNVETLRRRRLGVQHSFVTTPMVVVGVEIHRDGTADGASGNASASPTPEPPASAASPRRQQIYEVIPTRLVAPIVNRKTVILFLIHNK